MQTIYVFYLDTKDNSVHSHTFNDNASLHRAEDNIADFNADGFETVYAESNISAEHAQQLVIDKCLELVEKLENGLDLMLVD